MELHNLTIGYNSPLHTDINAVLNKGFLVCLIGLNGSGKSTLLRTMCGLIKTIKGEVKIDGKTLAEIPVRQRARLVTMVIANQPHIPHLTVEQFVAYARNPHDRQADKNAKAIKEAMASVGIEYLKDRQLDTLSDGERSRTMIAAALCQDTDYILLDEPTAHLDILARREAMKLLQNIAHEHNKGILIATHELDLACKYADMLWMLSKEALVEIKPPFTSSSELSAIFQEQ